MPKYQTHFKALGTKITLTVFSSFDQQVFAPSKKLIDYYEKLFSIYLPDSEISRINRAAGQKMIEVSTPTFDLVTLAKKISLKSWGFNAAIGPLVNGTLVLKTRIDLTKTKFANYYTRLIHKKLQPKPPTWLAFSKLACNLILAELQRDTSLTGSKIFGQPSGFERESSILAEIC